MGVEGKTEGVREGFPQLQRRREAEHSSTLAEGVEDGIWGPGAEQ